MGRRFPPPGVKAVPSYGCPPFRRGVAHAGGARVWQPQHCTIRGRSPRRCGRGFTWKSALGVGWHGFPESSGVKRSRAPPPRVPPRPERRRAAREGGMVEGATPCFLPLVRHRAGVGGAPQWSHHLPSPVGVAPSTVIPAGRRLSQPSTPVATMSEATSYSDGCTDAHANAGNPHSGPDIQDAVLIAAQSSYRLEPRRCDNG